jgi:hypothetical protein
MHPVDRLFYGRIVSDDPVAALCWVRDRDGVSLSEKYSSRINGKFFSYRTAGSEVTTGNEAADQVEKFNPYVYNCRVVLRKRAAIFDHHSPEEDVRIKVVQI